MGKLSLTAGLNCARAIDTGLSGALFDLTEFNKPMPVEARLPVRNLARIHASSSIRAGRCSSTQRARYESG